MPLPGLEISVVGCGSIIKKKLELYRGNYPDVQLFFAPEYSRTETEADVAVLPVQQLFTVFEDKAVNRLLMPPLIAFGAAEAMAAATAAGCADYLCEPWQPAELFERARRCSAAGRIALGGGPGDEAGDGPAFSLVCGADRALYCIGSAAAGAGAGTPEPAQVCLTETEYRLLMLMARNRGRFFDRALLSQLLGLGTGTESGSESGTGTGPESRAVDMAVSRLRARVDGLLESAGGSKALNPVRTASGRGWGICT